MKWWSAGAGLIFDAPRPKRGRGPRRDTSQRPRENLDRRNRAREETRTDVNFRGRRDARGSMKTAPRERDAARAASANARRTQVEHMKVVARMPTELSVEERNLLSVAYKNVIGSKLGATAYEWLRG